MNSYARKHFDPFGVFVSIALQAIILSVPAVCVAIHNWGESWLAIFAASILVGSGVKVIGDLCLRKCASIAEIAYFAMMYFWCYVPNADRYEQWMFVAFYISAGLELIVIILNTVLPRDDEESEDISSTAAATIVLIAGIIFCCICQDLGWSIGFDTGYDYGYGKGYEAGESDGYRDGYQEGYAEGEDYGYDWGYDAGHDSGVADSYTPSTYSYETYIGNANSYKFHRESCSYLPADWNQVFFYSREDAVNAGYDPCQKCNP